MYIILALFLVLFMGQGQVEAANVHFTWTASLGNPQGYIMERKSGLSGVYQEVTDPSNRPTATEWTDQDLPPNPDVSLCWQVRAFNELGTSGPSNEVCLRLPDFPTGVTVTTSGPLPDQPQLSIRTTIRKK